MNDATVPSPIEHAQMSIGTRKELPPDAQPEGKETETRLKQPCVSSSGDDQPMSLTHRVMR